MLEPSHRVLFLQHHSIYDAYGGVESYLHDLSLLSFSMYGKNSWTLLRRDSLREAPDRTPYPIHWVFENQSGVFGRIRRRFSHHYVREALKCIDQFQPSLLICTHISLAPMTALLSKLRHIPYSVIVYGIDCWGRLFPQDSWALNKADGIISISHWTKGTLEERGFASEKIHVVHPRLPDWILSKEKMNHSPDPHVFRMLTVGRMDDSERYKGHDHVLQALFQMRPTLSKKRLVYRIVGDGNDKKRIEQMAENLGLEKQVEFFPAVRDREELEKHYRESNVYVMPSRYGISEAKPMGEGFGIVYIEAASFGLPIVAYQCGGVMDIVRNGVNGILVEKDNIRALTGALEKLHADPALCEALGTRGQALVRASFNLQTVGAQFQAALREIGTKSSPPAPLESGLTPEPPTP